MIANEEADRLFGRKKTVFATCESCDQQFPVRGCSVCETKLTTHCLSCHLEMVHNIISDEILTHRDGDGDDRIVGKLLAQMNSEGGA